MIRASSIALAFVVMSALPAAAERLEVHSDVSRATITVQNQRLAISGPAPFSEDLPSGRYRLLVSSDGRRLGSYTVDVDDEIHLRGSRLSRGISSAILPGSGQWRDDGWWSGAVTGGGVALMMGRAVYFNVKADYNGARSDS